MPFFPDSQQQILSMDEQLQVNSFLQTEFFFYLLPCYYGVVAFTLRYFKLIETQPTYYVRKITGEWLFKYLESEEERNRNSDNLTYKVLPASYIIKSKLSLYNSYLYLVMLFLSFVSTASMFYAANHRLHSFLYLFGFLGWYMASVVLRREQQRGLGQSIWIHRIFWILAGTFSVYKMFEDYFLPLNLILNIFFIASNLVLAIYGIYRPEDSDTLQMSVGSEDIPGFIKILFQTIELNETVRYLLKIEDPINENINIQSGEITDAAIDQQDLIEIGKTFKHSADTIKTQINLLNELPRRNVFVDKKIRYVRVNDKFKSCYFILTQIGNSRFEAQRTLEEFRQLYATLKEVFTVENFPKHVLPKLPELYTPDQDGSPQGYVVGDHSSKSQMIQKWLDQVFKTPIFITSDLMKFLNVGKEQSAPFQTYFQNSYKMFCSKHFLVLMHNKNKKKEENTKESVSSSQIKGLKGYYNRQINQVEETANEKLLSLIKNTLEFSVIADNDFSDEYQFGFLIVCMVNKKSKLTWNISKIEENILSLNQRIEEECNCSVPYFYNMIGTKRNKYKAKLEAYRSYIQELLRNKKYYCTSLFFFLRFDPVKLEVNTTGNQLNFSTYEKNDQRKSRYLSEYEDKCTFIEVLRMDRADKEPNGDDIYKFKLRRKELTLNCKTTVQLKALREKLCSIYKGVSFIPELQFKDCPKVEAKGRIQTFLLKIESLPKIQISRDYLKFYEGSISER